MKWSRRYAFVSHAVSGPRIAMVLLLALIGIALLRLIIWLVTRERDEDRSERDYWRIHGG